MSDPEGTVRPTDDAVDYPPLPTVDGSGDIRIMRRQTFKAWCGRRDRLIELSRNVEATLRAAYATQLRDLQTEPTVQEKARELRNDLSMRCRVRGVDGVLHREGDLSAILSDMELSAVRLIDLGNFPDSGQRMPDTMIHISLGRGVGDFRAVSLTVRGSDKRWVGGVFDELSYELSRTVPKMSFLRGKWPLHLLRLAVALGVFGAVFGLTNAADRTPAALVLASIAGGVTYWISQQPLWRLVRWLVPPLELLEPGGTSKGSRIAAGSALILSLILSAAGVGLGVLSLK